MMPVENAQAPETVALDTWLNRRTLVLGDVNTGKTRLTGEILARMTAAGLGGAITVLDFAPQGTRGIGGQIAVPSDPDLLYLTAPIIPPRLAGTTDAEIWAYARQNAAAIEPLLDRHGASERSILVVNDASLYLHAGDQERLAGMIANAGTAVVNAYYGKALGDSNLSTRERRRTDRLAALFDRVLHLPFLQKKRS